MVDKRASRARSSLVERISIKEIRNFNDEQLKQAARGIIQDVLSDGIISITKWKMRLLLEEAERRRKERKMK